MGKLDDLLGGREAWLLGRDPVDAGGLGAERGPDLLERLLAGEPAVAAMPGPDEWTIRLDVRELPEEDVQRVADAVYAVLMPASVGR